MHRPNENFVNKFIGSPLPHEDRINYLFRGQSEIHSIISLINLPNARILLELGLNGCFVHCVCGVIK